MTVKNLVQIPYILLFILVAGSAYSDSYRIYRGYDKENNSYRDEIKKGTETDEAYFYKVYYDGYGRVKSVETYVEGKSEFFKEYHYSSSKGLLEYQKDYYDNKLIGIWLYVYNDAKKVTRAVYQNAAGEILNYYDYSYDALGHKSGEKFFNSTGELISEKKQLIDENGLITESHVIDHEKKINERYRYYYNNNKKKYREEFFKDNQLLYFDILAYDEKGTKVIAQHRFADESSIDSRAVEYYEIMEGEGFSKNLDPQFVHEYKLYFKVYYHEGRIYLSDEYHNNELYARNYYDNKKNRIKQDIYQQKKIVMTNLLFYKTDGSKIRQEGYKAGKQHGFWYYYDDKPQLVRWDYYLNGESYLVTYRLFNSKGEFDKQDTYYYTNKKWVKTTIKSFQEWDHINNQFIESSKNPLIAKDNSIYKAYLDSKSQIVYMEEYQTDVLENYYITIRQTDKFEIQKYDKEEHIASYIYYLRADNNIKRGRYYFHEHLDEEWVYRYNPKGVRVKMEMYQGDDLVQMVYYTDDGEKERDERYQEGKPNGRWEYYELGLLVKAQSFKTGDLIETQTWDYNSSGTVTKYEHYNFIEGYSEIKSYFPSGKVYQTERYESSSPVGEWFEYNEFGEVAKKVKYEKGKIDKQWLYFYDERQRLTRTEVYNSDGKLIDRTLNP